MFNSQALPPAQSRRPARRGAQGFTLPELLIVIVVVGIGLAGILSAFSMVTRSSADPVMRKQMQVIAEEMLEEIENKPYATAAANPLNGCVRSAFTTVLDYNGYSSSGQICATDGTPITALNGFSVAVQVAPVTLSGVSAALRIQVTVQDGYETLTLVGYRTGYAT